MLQNIGKNYYKIELITTFTLTLIGIYLGQVTVFYIIYLFWFQELIRTIIDTIFIKKNKSNITSINSKASQAFSSYFLLFIYFVFITVLFGIVLNFRNKELLFININVLLFRNWIFNINMCLFIYEYVMYRNYVNNDNLELHTFNRRHIILHVSIILGAIMQMIVSKRLNFDENTTNIITIIPFLLLKFFIEKPTKQLNK